MEQHSAEPTALINTGMFARSVFTYYSAISIELKVLLVQSTPNIISHVTPSTSVSLARKSPWGTWGEGVNTDARLV